MTQLAGSSASLSLSSASSYDSSWAEGIIANTQIRLLVDGKVARATSGKDNEQLLPATWEVGDLQGRTAHIEIVDEEKGGWGHINVDQIEFTDMPGNQAVMELLANCCRRGSAVSGRRMTRRAAAGRWSFRTWRCCRAQLSPRLSTARRC